MLKNIKQINTILNKYNEPTDEVQIISSKDWYEIINIIKIIKIKQNETI
tara:strand:- start:351 stop:497 length:147 start_codon:yes stop_codon:yes gene_type:complete